MARTLRRSAARAHALHLDRHSFTELMIAAVVVCATAWLFGAR